MGIVQLGALCLALVSWRIRKCAREDDNNTSRTTGWRSYGFQYSLDGVSYPTIDMPDIPAGYAGVDVSIDDGTVTQCKMVAGHVAAAASVLPTPPLSISPTSSSLQPQPEPVRAGPCYTLSPAPQWFLYAKAEKPRWGYEEEQAKLMSEWMKRWNDEESLLRASRDGLGGNKSI